MDRERREWVAQEFSKQLRERLPEVEFVVTQPEESTPARAVFRAHTDDADGRWACQIELTPKQEQYYVDVLGKHLATECLRMYHAQ